LAIIFLVSCRSKDAPPKGYIQPTEMKSVLWDVIRAQYLAAEMAKKDSSINTDAQTKVLSEKIFTLHKISEQDFNKSYQWYIEHPEVLQTIFDSLQVQKQREITEEVDHKKNPTLLKRPEKFLK
jgi:hypothetical protein